MEQKPIPDSQPASEPKPETATPPTNGSPLAIRNLFPGMIIGILVGIAGFLAYQKHLPQITQTFYVVTLTSFGVLILTFILLYAFKKQISTLIFGSQAANAGEIIDDAQKVSDALTDRFAEQLLRDVPDPIRQRVKFILPRLANWFVWSRFRNWWWQWILGIFVSLGGITGTILLMNQNKLLESQNGLIKQQMLLDEAGRRSALVVLMSNIMDKVDDEIKEQRDILLKKGISKSDVNTMKFSLSQSLIGQIAALSHSFKPYRFLDADTLIGKPLSPERGQLLITLTLLPLDTSTLKKIYSSATFERADLQNAVLVGAYLSGAYLYDAYLSHAILIRANLSEAYLHEADLSWANLSRANLSKAMLREADLTFTNLYEANLSEANLWYANFHAVNLREANLSGADLYEADLWESGLTLKQAMLVKTLFECKNLHDSLKLPLQKSHPQLFQEFKEE
jgi:uncharacterized protein YjbI with pentapeptide repeats